MTAAISKISNFITSSHPLHSVLCTVTILICLILHSFSQQVLHVRAVHVSETGNGMTDRDDVCGLIRLKQLQLIERLEQRLRIVVIDKIQTGILRRSKNASAHGYNMLQYF